MVDPQLLAFTLVAVAVTLKRPRVRQALEGVTGAMLIGLGVRLACERR